MVGNGIYFLLCSMLMESESVQRLPLLVAVFVSTSPCSSKNFSASRAAAHPEPKGVSNRVKSL